MGIIDREKPIGAGRTCISTSQISLQIYSHNFVSAFTSGVHIPHTLHLIGSARLDVLQARIFNMVVGYAVASATFPDVFPGFS